MCSNKKKNKHFPYLPFIIISFIVLLIISYIVYYNTILSSDEILKSNLFKMKEKYDIITDNLLLDKIFSNNIEGNILIDNTYVYKFVKDENKYYINTPNLGINTYVSNSIIKNFDTAIELNNISEYDYNKKFSFYKKKPIVEVSFSLDNIELERILKKSLKDDYSVKVILRNNAFSNEILNMEFVINNNKDTKTIIFSNNNILVNTNNNNYELKFNIDDSIFNVKIYINKKLYSILSGAATLNTYNYTYQKIDKLYTLNLVTLKKDDNYNYELSSNINDISSSLVLTISDISFASTTLIETIDNNNLTEVDKINYDNDIKFLKNFINKY